MLQSKIAIFLLLALCWISTEARAQTAPCTLKIEGRVIDDHFNESMPFAAISLRPTNKVTTTDVDGSFTLSGLCPNVAYHLEVHFIGHQEYHRDFVLTQDTTIDIRLHSQDTVVEEVLVEGQRIQEATLELAVALEAVTLRQTSSQSLGKMLEGINGVRTLQSGPSVFKPVIHGLHSSRILIYQNDIRLEGQQWGTEHAPEIDPFQAERVAVLKGAPAVRYGAEAIGGVVVVNPPALPTKPGMHGQVNATGNTNGRQGALSAQVEQGLAAVPGMGWRLQGTLKRGGDFASVRYGLPNTGIAEANVSGAIGIDKQRYKAELFGSYYSSQNAILRSAHIGNLTDLNAALAADTPQYLQPFTYTIDNPRQAINHTLMKADLEFPMTEWGGLDIIYGWQQNHRLEYDRRRRSDDNRPSMNMKLWTNTLDVHYHHPYREHWKGTVGVTGLWKVNDNISGTGVSPLIPAYRMGRGSVFGMEQYITDRWEAELGVRYDAQFQRVLYFKDSELIPAEYFFNNVSLTAGGLWHMREGMDLRTIVASAWRPPDVSELYSNGLHHGAAALELGDTTLQSEAAFKWLTTYSWVGEKARFEADVYVQRIQNYIYLNPTGTTRLTVRGAFPVFQYVQTTARLAGWDLSAQYRPTEGWLWSGQYSVVRGRDLDTGGYLFLIPADRVLNRLQYEGGEDRNVQWRVWAEHLWVARQTRVTTETDFSPPPPGYMLLNGGVALSQLHHEQGWELILQVQNALNTEYRDYMNRYRYFAAEAGRNISLTFYYAF